LVTFPARTTMAEASNPTTVPVEDQVFVEADEVSIEIHRLMPEAVTSSCAGPVVLKRH
jgi:hypothetical protein